VIFSKHFTENRVILLQTVAKWRCIKLFAIFIGHSVDLSRTDVICTAGPITRQRGRPIVSIISWCQSAAIAAESVWSHQSYHSGHRWLQQVCRPVHYETYSSYFPWSTWAKAYPEIYLGGAFFNFLPFLPVLLPFLSASFLFAAKRLP